MRNVYHHFADPAAMNASIARALKPGGRLGVLDFAPPDKEAARPADRDRDGMHGVTSASVERELKAAGFAVVSTDAGPSGPDRWILVVAAKPES
jgi:predicted methyltransferase